MQLLYYKQVCRHTGLQNREASLKHSLSSLETLFVSDLTLCRKRAIRDKTEFVFRVSHLISMSLYQSRNFKAKRQLYVVQNAFANYPRVTQKALD